MLKTLKFSLLSVFALLAIIVACNKSNDITPEEAVDQALFSIQERGGVGRFGCYELVFPVTLSLPDGTTADVDSYDAMKQTLRAFFEANGTHRPHASFVYPISVISQDGDLITVGSEDELRALRVECGGGRFGNHGPRGHGDRGLSCFEIVFPLTIEFPDGTTAEAANRQALHQLIRTWRQNNPGATERPQVTFPITVKMTDDGTLVTVNSREELHDLKAGCE